MRAAAGVGAAVAGPVSRKGGDGGWLGADLDLVGAVDLDLGDAAVRGDFAGGRAESVGCGLAVSSAPPCRRPVGRPWTDRLRRSTESCSPWALPQLRRSRRRPHPGDRGDGPGGAAESAPAAPPLARSAAGRAVARPGSGPPFDFSSGFVGLGRKARPAAARRPSRLHRPVVRHAARNPTQGGEPCIQRPPLSSESSSSSP